MINLVFDRTARPDNRNTSCVIVVDQHMELVEPIWLSVITRSSTGLPVVTGRYRSVLRVIKRRAPNSPGGYSIPRCSPIVSEDFNIHNRGR